MGGKIGRGDARENAVAAGECVRLSCSDPPCE